MILDQLVVLKLSIAAIIEMHNINKNIDFT